MDAFKWWRNHKKAFLAILVVIAVSFLANLNTTTTMGINYQTEKYSIPIYLKVLNFFDRHYNYQYLVKEITKNDESDKDKAIQLATWVNHNIKKIPKGVDMVDNHPWTIVQRLFGAPDQFSDLLSVLMVYADIDSFFRFIDMEEMANVYGYEFYPLTFFLVDGSWSVTDPYQGVYFVNEDGAFASLSDIKEGRWKVVYYGSMEFNSELLARFYPKLFSQLPSEEEISRSHIYERGGRANIQNPTGRLLYQLHKVLE